MALVACGPAADPDNPCDAPLQIVDETTGQVRLGSGGACHTPIFSRRPRAAEMVALTPGPGSEDDPCLSMGAELVYQVEDLASDLDFGPDDPPAEGSTVLDATRTLEEGTWVDVTLWSDNMLNANRVTEDQWSGRFQWGIPDSTEEISCFFGAAR